METRAKAGMMGAFGARVLAAAHKIAKPGEVARIKDLVVELRIEDEPVNRDKVSHAVQRMRAMGQWPFVYERIRKRSKPEGSSLSSWVGSKSRRPMKDRILMAAHRIAKPGGVVTLRDLIKVMGIKDTPGNRQNLGSHIWQMRRSNDWPFAKEADQSEVDVAQRIGRKTVISPIEASISKVSWSDTLAPQPDNGSPVPCEPVPSRDRSLRRDPEPIAMETILEAVDSLAPAARRRVLVWLNDREQETIS